MPEAELIAYHGWGFDASCWRPWQELLSDDVRWMSFDRGYFGNTARPHFKSENAFKIIMTHSFGFHLCSDELFKEADLVIIFAGFLAFHPDGFPLKQRSKKIVNEMILQFKITPKKILKAFYGNVFYPEENSQILPKKINTTLLIEDLKRLNNAKRSLPGLKKSAKVCIFHGSEDVIVPKQKGRALKECLGPCARYIEVKGAGHALPFTDAAKCLGMMKGEVIS